MALDHAPLGKSSEYPDRYAPELLFPVPRDDNRRRIGLEDGRWPWFGDDLWQAWELSWLRPGGVPVVAWGEFRVPAASPSLIESKSLKLYLNSLNQEVFSSHDQVRETIERDLSSACGAQVAVSLYSVDRGMTAEGRPPGAILIDDEPVSSVGYDYCPEVLKASGETVSGMTIHKVNRQYDKGEILFQASVKLDPSDSPEDIAAKVLTLEHKYYPHVLEDVILHMTAS